MAAMAKDELQWAADEDIQDFRFMELRKIHFGDSGVEGCNDQRFSLLCTSNHFGFTFVGCKTGLYAFRTALLYEVDKDASIGKRNVMAGKASIGPTHISTPAPPIHVALSNDSLTLSVCVKESGMVKIYFYDTRALTNKGKQMEPFCSIDISTEKDVRLLDLQWNPGSGFPNLLLVVVSTGVVSLLEITDKVTILVQRAGLQANCVCWSPKGKQLALGMKNGDVVQCTAKAFEEKRRHPQPPNVVSGKLMQVADLCWLTAFEFAVTYIPQDQSIDNVFMAFLSTPKDQPPSYTCTEDPYGYYGVDSSKKNVDKFHFAHMQQWGVLITCSNNSMDTPCFGQEGGAHGVIGDASRGNPDDYHGPWWQWGLDEGGRVEPPLDDNSNETHSVGVAIDYTSQEVVPISDTLLLPCSPLFLSLTDRGVLCPYTIVNTGCSHDKIAKLMSPPKPLPSSPVRHQISTSAPPPSNVVTSTTQTKAALPLLLKGFTQRSAPPMATLGQPNTSPKSNSPNLTGPTTGSGPSTLNSAGAAQKPFFGIANIGQPKPSFALGGGKVFGQPNLLPGQTAGPVTSGTSSLLNSGGLFLNTTSAPNSKPGDFSFSNPAANTGGLSLGRQQQNAVTTTTTYPSSGITPSNPGGGVLFPFSAKPGQLQSFSDAAKITSRPSAPPISGPPLFTSLGIGSGFSGLRTSAPALSNAPNKTPTTVVNINTSTPVLGSTVPRLGCTVPPSFGVAPPITTTPSGLGQKPPIVGLYQPQSTYMYSPLSTPKPDGAPGTGGLPMTTIGPMMSTLPKSGPALGTLQAKLPPATPVTTCTPVSSALTSRSQPPMITPSRPPPKTFEKTTKSNGDGTESVDGSADQEAVENRFAADISTEIDKFATEIDGLYDDILGLGDVESGTLYTLGKVQDLTAFSADTKALANNMQVVTKAFKASNCSSDHIKEETFKGFEMYEEARISTERNNDPKYASLLKVRPLDSYSAKRLNNLRASFLQVSRAIDEINSLLDAQLERKYEERRQRGKNLLKAPSIQTVYSTLRDQTRIIRLQNDSMANITDDMKKLKLIPKSWQSAPKIVHSSPCRPVSSPGPPATPRAERDRTPIRSTRVVQSREKLRECLETIKKTPVKKVKKSELSFRVGKTVSSASPVYAQSEGTCTSLSESPDTSTINVQCEPVIKHLTTPMTMRSQIASFVTSHQPTNRSLNTNSETSLGSFKPDVMVSPNRNISIRTPKGYESTSRESTTPQFSRQSSGPGVISSPDGIITIKDQGKYTKMEASPPLVKTNAPSSGTGTVCWGSPPISQPKTDITASHALSPPFPIPTPTPPASIRADIDLNSLRRTSPYRDLSQIRPPSSEDTEQFSLVTNTSLSVPNIAPNKSVGESLSLFDRKSALYASSPQVQQISCVSTSTLPSSLPLHEPPKYQIDLKPATASTSPLNLPVAAVSPVMPRGMALGVLTKSTVLSQTHSVGIIATPSQLTMPSMTSTTRLLPVQTTTFAMPSFSKSLSLPASITSSTFQPPTSFPFTSKGVFGTASTTKAFTNSPFLFQLPAVSTTTATTTASDIHVGMMVNTPARVPISSGTGTPQLTSLLLDNNKTTTATATASGIHVGLTGNAPAPVPISSGTGTLQLTSVLLDNNKTTKTGIEVPDSSNKDVSKAFPADKEPVVDIDSSKNIVEIDKTQHTLGDGANQQGLTTSEAHPDDLNVIEKCSTESVRLSPKISGGVKTPTQSEAISVSTAPISTQQATIEVAVTATQPSISSNNTLATAALSSSNSINATENTLKKEQQDITVSGAISSGVNGSSADSEGSNEEDDDAMIGDDMEPIDDSTGQNTPSLSSATPLGGLSLGLGRPQPTNVTANPFGTPNSSIITSPPTQPGFLRSSALGQGFQTSQRTSAPMFSDSNLVSGSATGMFGQKALFGSPPSLNASTFVSVPNKVFGSGAGAGGGATGVGSTFQGNQSSGIGLTFGNLANTGGGLGSDSVGFGSAVGGSLGFIDSPVGVVFGSRGGSTSTDFGALAGGSIGSGTNGNQSSFSGWR